MRFLGQKFTQKPHPLHLWRSILILAMPFAFLESQDYRCVSFPCPQDKIRELAFILINVIIPGEKVKKN